VIVHSIGPNGVYADVIERNKTQIKIKYYDARDGSHIIRWVEERETTMPKYTAIKPSVQVYFTTWVVTSEESEYVRKNKEQEMYAWQKDKNGSHNIVATIKRELHRNGHTDSILFTDSKEEVRTSEPIRSVRSWVMDKIKSKNPKTLYKNPRFDIMWEGYQWKRA